MPSIHDRVSVNGELGTVLFRGSIPAWPGETALGIEWDSGRGKHSGTHDGVTYFTTRRPQAGSFLKAGSKKLEKGRSVYDALVYRYGTEVAIEEIRIGKKVMEIYGFEKLQRLQRDFSKLRDISLSRSLVDGVRDEEEEELLKGLVELRRLDLSFNLLSSFDDVVKLLRNLHLSYLNLTGNRMFKPLTLIEPVKLDALNLTMTYPTDDLLRHIPQIFPGLKELSLCDNDLSTLPAFITSMPIHTLDLSMNNFINIPPTIAQTQITNLNLADNDVSLTTSTTFPNIHILDLKRNNISDWSEIDLLAQCFPALEELQMTGNPIFKGRTLEEVEFQVISRISQLQKLNGVEINLKEREDAELWFLSQVGKGEIKYAQDKFDVLSRKYGRVRREYKEESNVIQLVIQDGDRSIPLKVLQSMEILRLKSMIARICHKPYLHCTLSYQFGHFTEHLHNETSLISSYGFSQGQLLRLT